VDKEILIDIIGWIGSVEVILAYALISSNKVDSKSQFYQWLNLTGAILLIANTVYYGAFPSTAINLVWVVIAVVALGKVYFPRRSQL
jgi:phosphoglycerol transferase MdoB-like AlkP superfamily enzyme